MSQSRTARKMPKPQPTTPVAPPAAATESRPPTAREELQEEQRKWDEMAKLRPMPDYHRPGTFWWVQFNGKSNKYEPERIQLRHQGVGREFARMVPTIAGAGHLEVADHALQPQFAMSATPGAREKQLAPIAKAAFQVLRHLGRNGDATEAEYLDLLLKGQKKYMETLLAKPQSAITE